MKQHETINYIELPAADLDKTKTFFTKVFDWKFTDYGPDYCAFSSPTMEGGFYRSDKSSSTEQGSTLVVFYSGDLHQTETKIINEGGVVIKPVFSFPGGRRFHFADPNGNEFAVWSEC